MSGDVVAIVGAETRDESYCVFELQVHASQGVASNGSPVYYR
jgi:hypothetical protein